MRACKKPLLFLFLSPVGPSFFKNETRGEQLSRHSSDIWDRPLRSIFSMKLWMSLSAVSQLNGNLQISVGKGHLVMRGVSGRTKSWITQLSAMQFVSSLGGENNFPLSIMKDVSYPVFTVLEWHLILSVKSPPVYNSVMLQDLGEKRKHLMKVNGFSYPLAQWGLWLWLERLGATAIAYTCNKNSKVKQCK